MLTETVDRFDASFAPDHIGLIQGFLNPVAFDANGSLTDTIAAGDIIRGMTRQEGNHIDEFVTSALRNNLLGLPLDLATINLARGRDTGVPSLNDARRSFYEMTGNDAQLRPYESWTDFAANLKNEASIINFIAAYGTHELITGQTTLEGKRDAALSLITGTAVGVIAPGANLSDRLDFLNGTGAYGPANGLGGLDSVDLWIGGLAEKTMPFGGMLGSTFQFVFETQLESLQNGDRFYYLQRLDGLHLFGELEANSFAAMIMANTNATHLPSDVFSAPGLILEINPAMQFNDLNGDGTLEGGDPLNPGLLTQLVIRDNPATAGLDTDYLRYTGPEHVVLGGTENADILIASEGDDTLHGDGARIASKAGSATTSSTAEPAMISSPTFSATTTSRAVMATMPSMLDKASIWFSAARAMISSSSAPMISAKRSVVSVMTSSTPMRVLNAFSAMRAATGSRAVPSRALLATTSTRSSRAIPSPDTTFSAVRVASTSSLVKAATTSWWAAPAAARWSACLAGTGRPTRTIRSRWTPT